MECRYFGECGACSEYEGGYDVQLERKVTLNQERFKSYYNKPLEVFASIESHYRNRAEFTIWHVGDAIYYAMRSKEKKVVLIEECPQVILPIATMMPKLLDKIKEHNVGFKLFGVDFLSSSDGEMVISLLYHRKLDTTCQNKLTTIASELGVYIIGRSRKEKFVSHQDFITETLEVAKQKFYFKHIENSFTQPNARMNEKMIAWITQDVQTEGDLLELYCGAGNFTISFAKKFSKVLATEIAKSSIKQLRRI